MTIERIFSHFKDQSGPSTSAYDPNEPDSYKNYLHSMMADATDYETAFLAVDRMQAQLYYYGYEPWIGPYNPGQPYIGEDPNATLGEILNKDNENQPNRSTFVSTDVRDAVMMMLPSLVRLFGASEAPVALTPRSQEEVDAAEQATDYVNYVFWHDNPGFLILYGAFKDALTVKTGWVKWWTDNDRSIKRKTFENVTAEQIQMMLSEDQTAKIYEIGKPVRSPSQPASPMLGPPVGVTQPVEPPPMGGSAPAPMPPGAMAGAPMPQLPGLPSNLTMPPPAVFDHVIIEFEEKKPIIKVAGVPPEEMRLDRYARTFRDSRIIGHERIVPVDQLIAMGYDRDLCLDHIQTSESTFTTEPQLRNAARFMGSRIGDGVKYGEWYVKIDRDGDGVPELRLICTMGSTHEIVKDEEANRIKFALFSCDPISHTMVGDSLADYTEDIQRIKTNAIRSVLDSAAESLNPKTVINELMVDVDDAMSDEVGAVIRTRGDPANSVMFTNTPFLGQQMIPMLEMLNEVLQRRTGLSDAAKGLDPKALQSSTMVGVEAVINGAQERTELVARVLCETGFKDLFSGLYNEICENQNAPRTLKIRGKFIPYDTSTFDASMAVEVNPNLGKGSDMTRMMALSGVKQDQQLIIQQYGLQNPVVGVQEMLNTITDMLAIANVKNVGRYFKTPTPQQMQAIQSTPKTPDAMTMSAQAQMEDVRSKTAQAIGRQNFDREKHQSDLEFKRQQLQSDNELKQQQLKAKTVIDLQRIQLDSQKAGIEHHTKLAELASKLMKDQSDQDAQDQDNQINLASAQQDANLKGQQALNDQQMEMRKAASDHIQGLAKLASAHMLGAAKVASAHRLGVAKVASQHMLGALAAENQGAENRE